MTQPPIPASTIKDPDLGAESSFEAWRDRFLRAIQYGALIFGLIALVANIYAAPSRTFIIIYLSAYSILIISTFVPLPYNLRAGGILFILFALGVSGIVQDGLWGDARLFFLAFIGVSLLLFSPRVGYIAAALSLASLAIGGWLLHSGQIKISNPEVQVVGTTVTWITSATILLLLAIIFINGLRLFQQEFLKTQVNTTRALQTLQEERATLEERVEERTASLTRKTEQLRAASIVARQTAELQDLSILLNSIVNLITDQFGFYHTGIFLLNEYADQAVLQAASSEGGKRMMEKGHWLAVGTQGIVGYVAAQKKPRIALDVGEDAIFFNNPDLPMTRSEVALPLLIRGKCIGVLDIQSTVPQAFTKDDVDVLQTLADQISVAIESARLLSETQAAVLQLEAVTSYRTREVWDHKIQQKNFAFTYTPLGLRPEKAPVEGNDAIKVPISLHGQKIGTIILSRKDNSTWNKMDEDMVAEVASQVGLAVDNIRLLEDAQKSAQRDQMLATTSTRIRETLDIRTILQNAAREFQRALNLKETEVRLGTPSSSEISHDTARLQSNDTGPKKSSANV